MAAVAGPSSTTRVRCLSVTRCAPRSYALTTVDMLSPGLGTSTSKEAKEYFAALEDHKIPFEYTEEADDRLELAFSKKRVSDRKDWLTTFVVRGRDGTRARVLLVLTCATCWRSVLPHSRARTWTTVWTR